MNKNIIGVLLSVLVLMGLIWVARPDSSNDNTATLVESAGVLAVEESDMYSFGTISMAEGKVKHQFKMKNTGNEPVIVDKIYTSCMCTTAELIVGEKRFGPYGMPGHGAIPKIDGLIKPGEEAVVEAVFDPAAHGPAGIGRIQRAIVLENNAGQPVELQFVAVVRP